MKKIGLIITAALFATPVPSLATQCTGGPRIFADVPREHPLCKEIESLFHDGITKGCKVEEDGTRYFCPDEPLTRAQGAAFAEHRDPFAQVDVDGKTLTNNHVLRSERVEQGVYFVQFTRTVWRRCSHEGWAQDFDDATVEVDHLFGTTDTVVVMTRLDGDPADMRFNVRLHCR